MKTVVHIVPHAHWDREWYLPLEHHRARLIAQLDRVLDLLDQDPGYTYHLDGQMIAVEDYLSFRPEQEPRIRRFAAEGRLSLGPWYVLQDEYLTSGEANVRNLLHGMELAKKYGPVCTVGYLPDAFGNVGQMPQLLRQAGMKSAAFGRGVTLREQDPDPENHFPRYSEFLWQSPDGSAIPAVFFSGWYNNAAEIPTDPVSAKPYWDARLAHARRFSPSRHLLFLNGSDHQPVQTDLSKAMETARSLYPDIEFRCSDLERFAEAALMERSAPLETVSGELCGQESAGENTLCNTASSRAPIKVLNRKAESQLALVTEPMMAMAFLAGVPQEQALVHRAWKLVLENHPHDSICGCGIDAVHRETIYRYEKSLQLAGLLTESAGRALGSRIAAPDLPDAEAAFAVVNPSAWPRTQSVSATVGTGRVYGTRDARKAVLAQPERQICLCAADGTRIPCEVEDLGVQFGFELPEDRFRMPYFEHRYRITFLAEALPAFGYAVYYVKNGERAGKMGGLCTAPNRMENDLVAVTVRENGTFDLFDKTTGRFFTGLGVIEDTGDVGDEYIFQETTGEPVRSDRQKATVTCIEDLPWRAAFRIETVLKLPVSADEQALSAARESMEPRLMRRIARSSMVREVPVETVLTLEQDSPAVRMTVRFENTVRDHRLRVLFPTDYANGTHIADSVFDLVSRSDVPGPNWTNPSRCQRMQYLVAAEDETGGLAVLNRGSYEYEILSERKQIAVTVLRSVGELGDWGVFPTPDAQCLEPIELELGILPYAAGELKKSGCRDAVQFQAEPVIIPVTEAEGILPQRFGFLTSEGDGICVTAFKPSEDGQTVVVRGCNLSEQNTQWKIGVPGTAGFSSSDICERNGEELVPDQRGTITISAGGKEMKTIRIGTC